MAKDYIKSRPRALKFLSDHLDSLGPEFHPLDAYLSIAMRLFGKNQDLAKGAADFAKEVIHRLAGSIYGMLADQSPKLVIGGGVFTEQVPEASGVISQPNAYTCQAACIEMAFGTKDVMGTRAKLEAIGNPGDPAVMGKLLKQRFGDRYIFDDNACLSEIRDWLKAGEFLITHGWFTNSGHVIVLKGVQIDPETLGFKILVVDPWSEFDGPSWSYNKKVDHYEGCYSARLLYAAIVAGQSCQDASAVYRSGKMDSMHKGAWIHRILPPKKP